MADIPSNADVAAAFALLGDLLEIDGASRHRVLAYRRATERILDADRSFARLALDGRAVELPDIGKTIQAKTVELVETGDIAALATLRTRLPEGLAEIARLRGLGPKRARLLWDAADIGDIASLRDALAAGRLDGVSGLGAKTIASIAAQLAEPEELDGAPRVAIGRALPLAERLVADLGEAPGVEAIEIAGGLRRGAESVHDIDLAAATTDPAALAAALAEHEAVSRVVSQGEHRVVAETHSAVLIELRSGPPESFGNLLQHLTGSAAHNTRLRERAVRIGLSVSEHGITDSAGAEATHRTEAEVYAALGLAEIPPELREDDGELQLAEAGAVPRLVTGADLRGELHAHTDWSDGRASLKEMIAAARARDYEYLVITDHSRRQAQAGGLDVERLRRQGEVVKEAAARLGDLVLAHGSEVDVLPGGGLDFPDEVLAELDFVVASPHSGFTQPPEKFTGRLIAAAENPYVDVIGHPTGRMLNSRDHRAVDLDALIAAAILTDTALEINAQPRRLDLDARMARRARDAGAMLSIDADAHSVTALDFRRFGVLVARRARLGPDQVLNTLPWPEIAARRARRIAAA
ncbi:MAG: DNA polymerase/3'-5' exonuclease PolX [Thermoleophilia bacterium]|nr:DNA polymerase/3'-5' exonuclease PolX [Thermoleophilia bacterium]MDH3725229.1 DNA polymerase/3'-5' exonuclease PolX [Thermoleophilia bacterium]